ncbi:uncharacterized protein GIQ15_03144 [Arthroderma uncinatum]|uniref:uncharacterized protein n=1 Tax=Arthroderma uncinatum TaxID=74035 RepID=UPI00144A945A|nr:uncharacterized protein GIQ15_03144 [Arthroderma uncinatum]KAF3483820.1 hypothetical protein GIQ15_03144 [Arthroderma uncinatum]
MDPEDVGCLSLCNHSLLETLGRDVWRPLCPESTYTQKQFLTRLERDIPTHFFCHTCSALHLGEQVNPPGPKYFVHKKIPCDDQYLVDNLSVITDAHPRESAYRFIYFHVKLAMKRHYYGPEHGISTESLFFTEVHDNISNTTLLSAEARICEGPRLCMRFQTWAVAYAPDAEAFVAEPKFLSVCEHINMKGDVLPQMVKLAFGKLKSGTPVAPKTLTCESCYVDYQLEMKQVGSPDNFSLVITKWLDLGAGLTAMDKKWLRYTFRTTFYGTQQPGIAMALFESAPGPSLDSITQTNNSYLVGDRYKVLMERWAWCYIKQYGKWSTAMKRRTAVHYFLRSGIILGFIVGMICVIVITVIDNKRKRDS